MTHALAGLVTVAVWLSDTASDSVPSQTAGNTLAIIIVAALSLVGTLYATHVGGRVKQTSDVATEAVKTATRADGRAGAALRHADEHSRCSASSSRSRPSSLRCGKPSSNGNGPTRSSGRCRGSSWTSAAAVSSPPTGG